MEEIHINNFEEVLYKEKLDNGLTVYMLPFKYKKSFFCMMMTKFGGKDISFIVDNKRYDMPSGIAHFLEHKLFESNEEDPFSFYAKSGTDVNASTNPDYTCYYFFGNKSFNKNLKYLISWINNFEVNDSQVEKEKEIILEEASMNNDKYMRVLNTKLLENILFKSTYRVKTIGTEEDIKKITKEDLLKCYNTFYKPDNMYLIITGAFDPYKALEIIKKENISIVGSSNVQKISYEEEDDIRVKKEIIKMDIEIPEVSCAYKINKNNFKHVKDKVLLDLYLYMIVSLAFGSSSNFYEELINKKIASSFTYEVEEIENHYLIKFFFASKSYEKVIKKIDEKVISIDISRDEFERKKKALISGVIRGIDDLTSTLYDIVDDIISYGEYINNKIDIIKSVNYNDMLKIKDELDFNNKCVVILKNDKTLHKSKKN